MSSIKDAEYAMNGEPEIPPAPMMILKEEESVPVSEFVLFKLVNSSRSGGVHIPGIDYVIDPRTITKEKPNGNGPEMIRLVEGVSTIWAKEQKEIAPEILKKNVRSISFVKGSRFNKVPSWDVTLLEFMRVCRHNAKSKNRTKSSKVEFFEYDPHEVAKERLASEMLEIEMVIKAKEQPFDAMQKHAFYLGIKLINELGMAKKEDALRAEYMVAAKRDPKNFKKTVGSQEVEVAYLVRTAIVDSKIDVSRGDGRLYWSNGGDLICSCPKNENPVEVLTNLALQKNKDGKEFYDRLKFNVT